MALQKTITTATGYDANYLIIADVQNVSFLRKTLTVTVVGYKDAATRNTQGAQPILGKQYQFNKEKFTFTNTEESPRLWEQVYEALKTLPEFTGATDV